MAIIVEKSKTSDSLLKKVKEICGVDPSLCYQCKRCTSGCPVSKLVGTKPSEIMRKLHLNVDEEVLCSDILWMCVSCETCTARCPMGIDVAAVMDALRHIALEKRTFKGKGNVPLFNKAFLKTVKMFGRTYDIAMIAAYKLGTLKLMHDTEKFPKMLKKGKIALMPSFSGDTKTVKRIFKKVKQRKRDE